MRMTAWNSRLAPKIQKDFLGALSTDRICGASSTDCEKVMFGFAATLISIVNNGTDSVFVNLASSMGTTNDAEVMSGDRLEMSLYEPISTLTLTTAATSGPGQSVDILALGNNHVYTDAVMMALGLTNTGLITSIGHYSGGDASPLGLTETGALSVTAILASSETIGLGVSENSVVV